jgi:hypothetical protein
MIEERIDKFVRNMDISYNSPTAHVNQHVLNSLAIHVPLESTQFNMSLNYFPSQAPSARDTFLDIEVLRSETVFSSPMVQQTSMISMHNNYFVSTVNSNVDVATYSDSVLVASASNYSDVLVHACHNSEYVQKSMSTMHNGINNIQHAPAYSHSSAIEQIDMPMNNYHDQTNIIYPKKFHATSYVSGPNNFQHGVSSSYSSVENSHCINRSRHMLMNERIGQLNSNCQANYSKCLYAIPHVVEKEVMPTCSTPYASCNFHDLVSYVSNDYSRINENSSNLYTPPHATVSYPLPTTSAPYVVENHSRINGISLSIPCEKQLIAEQCSVNEGHQDVEGPNPEDMVGGIGISTPGDFQHNWRNRSLQVRQLPSVFER